MNYSGLLEKLIDLERAIGKETPIEIRRRVIEAQEYVLHLQRQAAHFGGSTSSKKSVARFSLVRDDATGS